MEYEQDIYIDETALDVEWLDQPSLMVKYGKKAAKSRENMELKKEAAELVKAELEKSIRANPEKYGVAKITESAVQSTILLQPQYQKAIKTYIEARFESDVARYTVDAMHQKKDALENLVRLHGQQYFAGPKVPRDLTKEWEVREKQKRVDAKITLKRGKK